VRQISLQRDSARRDEQVGQKTEWCSVVRGQASGLGKLAVGDASICMRDRLAQEGQLFIYLSCLGSAGSIESDTVCMGQSSSVS